ncbi:hypothetical protein BU24DRAFT_465473 [Aaosphaeria arxii CBS 175.79]|uniref:Alpha/beta-hydrolase n=1 Tax=Aaosphaeria arxii CBS 175.79 TaxID=1450172 RepID=A0A6A5XF68_9PLEO|nr:uncharacterized protein BU24DRAFT_465473 [Aaosphaeria arxii CBS 175.79]KAF2011885.1 hypothetical protein BU24DRAFT_465473 [Aaosphaeria arxii CBS 175.79]
MAQPPGTFWAKGNEGHGKGPPVLYLHSAGEHAYAVSKWRPALFTAIQQFDMIVTPSRVSTLHHSMPSFPFTPSRFDEARPDLNCDVEWGSQWSRLLHA